MNQRMQQHRPCCTNKRFGFARNSSRSQALILILILVLSLLLVSASEERQSKAATGPLGQGPDLNYSKFNHKSQKHSSLKCTDCHQRTADNSITPTFPGHPACQSCHLGQFVTPSAEICAICHADLSVAKPPPRSFSTTFKESFNVKFDHKQHLTGSARPPNGCGGCHDRPLNRGVALSIPASINAHRQCYACHKPGSTDTKGQEMASCGVCHEAKTFGRTSTNARAFGLSFSHAQHGVRQSLSCTDCHKPTGSTAQSRQLSSPRPAEHLDLGSGTNCLTCHNGKKLIGGKRVFGGDLAFKDCKRCHTGSTFRLRA